MTVKNDTKIFDRVREGDVVLLMVMESGREWSCDILLEETNMSSVFSSFSFSMLVVIHDLMSPMQSCMALRRSEM